jgi:hypothetical protein
MCSKEGFKFCWDTKNNGALPLDPACPKLLNVQSPTGLPNWGKSEVFQNGTPTKVGIPFFETTCKEQRETLAQ